MMVYSVLYLVLILLTILPGISQYVRGWFLILLIYILGVIALARGGLAGSGREYMILLPVVAFVLVGVRPGMIAAGMSLFSLAVFTYLASERFLDRWLIYPESPLDLGSWLTEIVPTMMVIVIIMLLLYSLHGFLIKALTMRQEELMNLKQMRSQMDETQLTTGEQGLQGTTELEVRVKEPEVMKPGDQVPRNILLSLSHEIRTAMNTVMGMTSLLLDTELSEEQRECTKAIRVSGEALLSATSKMLDYPKGEEVWNETEAQRQDEYHVYLLELINAYLESTPHLIDGMRTAIALVDDASLRIFASDLEKSSGEFGATQLIELAREMEVMGSEEDMSRAAEKLGLIEQEYANVRQALEKKKTALIIG
jgi:signal transduction histidine kinase